MTDKEKINMKDDIEAMQRHVDNGTLPEYLAGRAPILDVNGRPVATPAPAETKRRDPVYDHVPEWLEKSLAAVSDAQILERADQIEAAIAPIEYLAHRDQLRCAGMATDLADLAMWHRNVVRFR